MRKTTLSTNVAITLGLIFLMVSCSFSSTDSGLRFVCYYQGRPTPDKAFTVDDIDPNLCTHMIYERANLDAKNLTIQVGDIANDIDNKGYEKFVALKKKNPNLKLMIGIGGWEPKDTSVGLYSQLIANKTSIDKFVESSVAFLQRFQFDGLQIEWQLLYREPHQEGFVYLVTALRKAFRELGYLLGATVTPLVLKVRKELDVASLNKNLDFVDIMAFHFHGEWEQRVDHHARLYDNDSFFNADDAITQWIKKGFLPNKLILGIPLFGRGWTLTSNVTIPKAPGEGGITASYHTICGWVLNENWTVVRDPTKSMGPYVLSPTTPRKWIGYDDPAMAFVKTKYALAEGLGGVSVYSLDMDDFQNKCGNGRNPVMTAIAETLNFWSQDFPERTSGTLDLEDVTSCFCTCICS